jgi:hypothetical protein
MPGAPLSQVALFNWQSEVKTRKGSSRMDFHDRCPTPGVFRGSSVRGPRALDTRLRRWCKGDFDYCVVKPPATVSMLSYMDDLSDEELPARAGR